MTARFSGHLGGHLLSLLVGVSFSLSAVPATQPVAVTATPADVTAANWYWGPANRWSWHNTRRIFPTAQVSRGSGPVAALAHADRDLSKITFADPVTHQSMTVAEMLDATYTDGFLVLQHGRILAESYRNGLT